MGLPIYDFRKDIRNVLVTPQIRSRFMQLDPGAYAEPHSHDLGHEIFIVMQGRAIFEIDGESGEFGPGQMCVALVDQLHSIQVTSDEPMIMYLSVTPHIVPTHTMWDSEGRKLPYTFGPPSNYDKEPSTASTLDLAAQFTSSAAAVSAAAAAASDEIRRLSESLAEAAGQEDGAMARDARNSLWEALFPLFRLTDDLAELWNDLAPRAEGLDR